MFLDNSLCTQLAIHSSIHSTIHSTVLFYSTIHSTHLEPCGGSPETSPYRTSARSLLVFIFWLGTNNIYIYIYIRIIHTHHTCYIHMYIYIYIYIYISFSVRVECPARCSRGRRPLIAGCLSLRRPGMELSEGSPRMLLRDACMRGRGNTCYFL